MGSSLGFGIAPLRQRRGDGSAFVTTQREHAADERGGVHVEEEEASTVASPSSWDAAVKAEVERYETSATPGTTRTDSKDAYRPGPMGRRQLRLAAEEFVKRCRNGNEEDLPFVLVSRNCKDMPSRAFELAALRSSRQEVAKLWYALTKSKELLIVKYASDSTERVAVTEIACCVGNFEVQHDSAQHAVFSCCMDGKVNLVSGTTVAPDVVLQRTYPEQGRPFQVRTSFIVEVECENAGPKALMLQLSEYTLQPVADYVLGIKVYKRSGPPTAPGGAKRPFAAIALLWRRGAAPPGGQVSFVQAWSFGSCALPAASRDAFCLPRGNLQPVQPGQIVHPASHTLATDTIVIPNAQLVQGVEDENGAQIAVNATDSDLTIDLARIRSSFERLLPP